jgi:signal transduction histidine kinase
VRKVVDAHGGQVGVEASPQTGTTFTVVLPRQP